MLRIYNTLTRKKEIFKPIDPGKVGIYVCGVTVYDSCHVGHARSMVVFDVIVRYLRFSGYSVRYVRNFTDIDDKIIRRANSDGTDIATISDRYIKEFHVDMDALGVERASVEPRATDHIKAIIDVIGKLVAKPGEPFWESPWGKGRPGWHIECSAMSARYLGPHFDIHGGGKDLIFPHHENEIAQSEGAFEVPFANYWIHNGFVNINHEKMSKSLGNFLTIEDILKQFHPEAVRLFLLSNHYRSPVDFSNEAVSETEKGLHRMYALLERIAEFAQAESGSGTSVSRNAFEEISQFTAGLAGRFKENMDDDFNTARVVGLLFDAVHRLNRFMDELSGPASREINDLLLSGKEAIVGIGRILGILTLDPREFFGKKQDKTLMSAQIDEAAVKKLIAERTAARKNKDWARADEIRDLLAAMDIVIEDRHDKTVWKVR
jgi:cysteinyl-tRNA synthetase